MKYGSGIRYNYANDLTGNNVNIDVILDVLTATQKAEGIAPTFQLANKDEYGHIINDDKTSNCKSCKNNCKVDDELDTKPHHITKDGIDIDLLNRPLGEPDDDGDDDVPYICDLCTSLGYSMKYISDICDNCTACESCPEYQEECDGCSYSVFRDGTYYRSKLDESELIGSDDQDIFNSLDDSSDEILPFKGFSVSEH